MNLFSHPPVGRLLCVLVLIAAGFGPAFSANAASPAPPRNLISAQPRPPPPPPPPPAPPPPGPTQQYAPSARSRVTSGAYKRNIQQNGSVYYGGYGYSSPDYYYSSEHDGWDDNTSDHFSTITPGGGTPSAPANAAPRAYSLQLPPGLAQPERSPLGGVRGQRGMFGADALNELPPGAEKILVNGKPFYREDNTWYRPYFLSGQVVYYEVSTPVGAHVQELPEGYALEVAGGVTNAVYQGVYYRADENGYVVVEPPVESTSRAPAEPERTTGPDPFELFQRMSACLDAASRFSFSALESQEETLDTGEAVQISSWRSIDVRRPNGLRADVKGDTINRRFWYDGRRATLLDQSRNSYATFDAPPTIDSLLDTLAQRFNLTIPLSDLMYTNLYARLRPLARAAEYKGIEAVDAQLCHHLAFSGDWVDWDVWVQEGEQPLPRKIVITYKQIPGAPRYLATLPRWDLEAAVADGIFEAELPPDAVEIEALAVAPK